MQGSMEEFVLMHREMSTEVIAEAAICRRNCSVRSHEGPEAAAASLPIQPRARHAAGRIPDRPARRREPFVNNGRVGYMESGYVGETVGWAWKGWSVT